MIVIPAQAGTQWRQFSVFAIELTLQALATTDHKATGFRPAPE
jgi:hypothetical protein